MASVKETLISLHLQKFTGKVVLRKDQVIKSLYFKKGNPIYVDSSVRSETLGQTLLEHGRITEEQYLATLAKMEETGKRQGETLVELGFLTGFEVYEALKDQVNQKFQNCFLLEDATIEREEGEATLSNIAELPINFFRNLIELTAATFTSDTSLFPENRALLLNSAGKDYLTSQALGPTESKVVRLLDGKLNFDGVLDAAAGDPDEVAVLLTLLSSFHYIDTVNLPPQRFSVPADQVAKEVPKKESEKSERRTVTIAEEKQPPPPASPIYAWALKIDRPLNEFLKIDRTMTRIHVRKAFEAAVRELHLDNIAENYSEKDRVVAEKVFDRLTLAVTVLEDDKRRHQYMQDVAKMKPGEAKQSDPAIQAEVCIQKARIHLSKKRFAEAEQLVEKATELSPKESSYFVDWADILLHRALAEKITPLPKTIDEKLKKALSINSQDAKAFLQAGIVAKLEGDLDKARSVFQKVLEIQPNNNQALSELRLINRRLEDKKKSESSFLKLFKKK